LFIKSLYFIKRVKGSQNGQWRDKRRMRVPILSLCILLFSKTKLRESSCGLALGTKTLGSLGDWFQWWNYHPSWSLRDHPDLLIVLHLWWSSSSCSWDFLLVAEFFYCSWVILFGSGVLPYVNWIFVEKADFIKENRIIRTLAEFYTNLAAFLESGQ
jgi:hypothetical protein